MRCPRCGFNQPSGEECICCGMIIAKFKARILEDSGTNSPSGAPSSIPLDPEPKDPATALVLNFLFPGTGYVYLGRKFFGVSLFIIFMVCVIGTALGLLALLFISGAMSVVGAMDGYLSASRLNQQIEEASPEEDLRHTSPAMR
jgi:hypothetical protein